MSVNVYKPGSTAVTVGGYPISGWADGEFINLEFADEGARMVIGADGEATHVVPSDTSGTLTLTLKQDADANRILGAFVAAKTQVKVMLRDNLGFTAFSKDCMVKQHAARPYAGRDLSNRTWVVNLPRIVSEYPTNTTPAT